MQQRCATLARMGAVVFSYSMVGYNDSTQVPHHTPHAFTLQLWNSIRAVDFVSSLERVDAKRIAVTGASGGGTQTFMLAAVDPRMAVSCPVVMVSSDFYGGCVCESGLPVHRGAGYATNNAEIAALASPRPLLVISDGKDWTKDVPTRRCRTSGACTGFSGRRPRSRTSTWPTRATTTAPRSGRRCTPSSPVTSAWPPRA